MKIRLHPSIGLVVALLASGCSGGSHFEAGRTISVDPGDGGGEEVGVRMAAGEQFTYSWSSTGNLHFNVHSHRNGEVFEWKQGSGTSGAGTFKADLDDAYYLYWVNEGTRVVSLTYTASGEGQKVA
jgi:hypothetical protein